MFAYNNMKSAATLLTLNQLTKLGATLSASAEVSLGLTGTDCHDQVCHPVEQYCSHFEQKCSNCSSACNLTDSKYEPTVCIRECSDFVKLQPLKNEIHQIQTQQNIILYLLILLLIITCAHYTWKCLKWLQYKRCVPHILKRLRLKKDPLPPTAHLNGKDLGGTTIQNMCVINDVERAPSQIYSMTGAEGSVMTMTTPISSRHPAENTTPSPQPNEYSYDNQALAVTPVSEKPGGTRVFLKGEAEFAGIY